MIHSCRNHISSSIQKMKKCFRIVGFFFFLLSFSCSQEKATEQLVVSEGEKSKEFYVVPGEDEEIDPELIKKGKVLISYSDCDDCHREDTRAKGPSFTDIAKRYPIRQVYIDLLARKVISGGTGVWGYPVMGAHPKLSMEDAQAMVSFILSLEEK